MTASQNLESRLDRELHLLASYHRRLILRYLAHESDDRASLEELVDHVATHARAEPPPSQETIRTTLHHSELPKLDDYGVIEYEPGSGAVRYRSRDRIERLLECIRGG